MAKSLLREPHSLVLAECLDTVFKNYPSRDFQVRFWDEYIWGAENKPRFALILKHAEALRALFSSPSELTLGEAYIHDDFDIEGDIEAAFDLADYLLDQKQSLGQSFDLNEKLHQLSKSDHPRAGLHLVEFGGEVHSKERNRQAICYHYDLPAEFYALWLDPRMVYSCAYFATPDQDLDSAQEQKLDYICRKLRLHRGERTGHRLRLGCANHTRSRSLRRRSRRDHTECAAGWGSARTGAPSGCERPLSSRSVRLP
jgi:cyclopropane-fatty-acyl-phospholipid synthase